MEVFERMGKIFHELLTDEKIRAIVLAFESE
jgi:hypothetical protein